MRVWQELRRRRVLRTIGLYVVGAWLVIQVASTFFPAWGIPDTALRALIIAAVFGSPIAVIFGWLFNITSTGIVRTGSASPQYDTDYSLQPTDYGILVALAAVSMLVIYSGYDRVRQTTTTELGAVEKHSNSIAILPFENLDDATDSEYFSDGITEELLHRLSAFKSLRVLGRTSSFTFKDSGMTIPKISDMLGVRYLLQGSVRREANQIRITTQLLDDSGFQVWSETFDRKLEGVFAIQTDIANTVAQQLIAEIVPQESSPGSTTSSNDAYQEYLIGRDFLYRRESNWAQHAAEAFRRSIELDPLYAPPYAALAVTKGIHAGVDISEYKDDLDAAQRHVDRALELSPNLAEAHAAQGLLLTLGPNANFIAAEAALRRALGLDPTIVSAYNWLSIALDNQGKFDQSWQAKQDALKIDPLNSIINGNVAIGYSGKGDFHRAEQLLKRMTELPDPATTTYWSLDSLYVSYGRLSEAVEISKKIAVFYHEKKTNTGFIALSNKYRYLGMNNEADYWLEKYIAVDPNGMNAYFTQAYALRLQGKYDEMERRTREFLGKNSIDPERLPTFFAEVLGAIRISIGDYDEGIALTENIIDMDKEVTNISGGGLDAIDFMHQLAYAYQKTGQSEEANEVLAKAANHLQTFAARDITKHPKYLQTLAISQVMRGDTQGATVTFENAVQAGWRNYFFVINDPRWGDFFDEPAMKSLMAFVKADIDRQARIVRDADDEEDFRAVIEQLDARTPLASEN